MGIFSRRRNDNVVNNPNTSTNGYGAHNPNVVDPRVGNNNYGTRDNALNNGYGAHDAVTKSSKRGRLRSRRNTGEKGNKAMFDIDSGYYNRRPSFGQWYTLSYLQ